MLVGSHKISILTRRETESGALSAIWGHSETVAICKPGRGLLPEHGHASILTLTSASRIMRSKWLLFKLPNPWYFVIAVWVDQIRGHVTQSGASIRCNYRVLLGLLKGEPLFPLALRLGSCTHGACKSFCHLPPLLLASMEKHWLKMKPTQWKEELKGQGDWFLLILSD